MELPESSPHDGDAVPGLLISVEEAITTEAVVNPDSPLDHEKDDAAGRRENATENATGDLARTSDEPVVPEAEVGSDVSSSSAYCRCNSRETVAPNSQVNSNRNSAQRQEKPYGLTRPRTPRSVTMAEGADIVLTEECRVSKASRASTVSQGKSQRKQPASREKCGRSPRKRSLHQDKSNTPHKRFTLMKELSTTFAAEAASAWERRSRSSTVRQSGRGHRTTAEGVLSQASANSPEKPKKDDVGVGSISNKTETSHCRNRKKNLWSHSSRFFKGWRQTGQDETADFAATKFHIREGQNPDLGERLTQIYNRIGPPDGNAWSYQSAPAVIVTGCICFISLWTLWFAPFIASFWNAYQPLCEALTKADLALDIIYAVCTLLTLKISYVDMNSRVEVIDPIIIRTVVSQTPFFYYELLSSCFVVLVIAVGSSVRFLLLLKLLRAVHFCKMPRWTDPLRVKPMFRVFRLLAALFTAQHGVACVLNYVIEKEDHWDYYIGQAKGDFDKYTLCYNYGINMLQAQISKGELLSRVQGGIYCIVAPLGTIMVATLYGEINVLYQRLNILSDRHIESMAYITEAMRTLKLPSEMQGRVHQYFRFLHANRDRTAVSTLLDSLSEPLLQELKLNLYGDLVHKAKFFKDCSPEFIRTILMKLHDRVYCPGDNIIQTGQEGDCMYFILKGSVDVLVEGSPIFALKREGDYFGELALLKPGTSRTATLRARTYTIVARLYARDFDEALEKFPHEMMSAFAGMNLLAPKELVTTLEEAKARIARAKEKKNA